MRRWVWRVLLTLAVLSALTVGASAAETVGAVVSEGSYKYTFLADNTWEITQYIGNGQNATIPDKFRGHPVTSIGDLAFANKKSLTKVTLPDCVTKIGVSAFYGTGLSEVTIPAKVVAIEEHAFESCTALTSLTFRDNVNSTNIPATISPITEIGESAFAFCTGLKKLDLPGTVKKIGPSAFSNCSGLTSVVIADGTEEIGNKAFFMCNAVTTVVIAGEVKPITKDTFNYTKLTRIHYGGTSPYPGELPDGWTLKDNIHEVQTNRTVLPSDCGNNGSITEPITCGKGCVLPHTTTRPIPKGHDYTDITKWVVTYEPTNPKDCQDRSTTYVRTCSKCGHKETSKETSRAIKEHTPKELTAEEQEKSENIKSQVNASCSATGSKVVITKRCAVCNEELDTKTVTIEKTAHTYDPKDNQEHILIKPTCKAAGLKVADQVCSECDYINDPTANCEDCKAYWGKKEPTDTETTAYITHVKTSHGGQEIDRLEHEWDEPKFVVTLEPTCLTEGKQVKKQLCKVCEEENPNYNNGQPAEEEKIDALGHDLEEGKETITTNPTCTEKGKKTVHARKCLRTGCSHIELEKTNVDIDALGHDWKESGEDIIKEPSCKEEGQKKVSKKVCTRCDAEEHGGIMSIPKTAHKWGTPVKDPNPGEGKEDKPATCGKDGVEYVIVTCENKLADGSICGETEHKAITIPATGQHDWGEWTTKEPTATQPGEKKRTCKTCNKEDKIVLPATGDSKPDDPDKPSEPEKPKDYQVTIVQGAGGTASANRTTAKKGDKVTVTVSPSSGYVVDMVRVITADGKVPALTDLGGGKYRFTMPEANVEIRATFERKNSGPSWIAAPEDGSNGDPRRTKDVMPTQNPTLDSPKTDASQQLFKDVPLSHWAAGEINWANQMGYMNGSGGGFNPDGAITHQQMWMVLARLTGSNPAGMEDARRWAVQGGFADGSSPTGAVKRHQLVTALYRCARLSGSANQNTTSLAGYTDSRSVPAVARDAFSWALANGILSGGANKTLNPNGTLTRAQFAVILYRYSQRI